MCTVLHTAPSLSKWLNWSCPVSNHPVSNSLIWVNKQLHTSPPQSSRLLHTPFISHSHSACSHACTSMDSHTKMSGFGQEIQKWDSSLPCRPARSFWLRLTVMSEAASRVLASTSLGLCVCQAAWITQLSLLAFKLRQLKSVFLNNCSINL